MNFDFKNKNLFILGLFLVGFWIIFFSFQNESIYKNTLGKVANNWVKSENIPVLRNIPYKKINSTNLIRWDAVHYNFIQNYGYDIEKAGGDFIFAFFPFFPLICKIFSLPPIGIVILNSLFFIVSIILLVNFFPKQKTFFTLISIATPSIVIFFIPYTEGLYFITITIGLIGLLKNNYKLYFIGFILASLSRPSMTILFFAIILTQILLYLNKHSFKIFFKNIFYKTIPIILGSIIVSLIQWMSGSGSVLKFVEVQKYWDHSFTIPTQIKDWSEEGYGIHIALLVMFILPVFIFIVKVTVSWINNYKKIILKKYHTTESLNEIFVFSAIYMFGNTLFILFFQNGFLHGMFRFVMCNPFFYFFIFYGFNKIKEWNLYMRFVMFMVLFFISYQIMNNIEYSSGWNFSDTGFFLTIFFVGFWMLQDLKSKIIYKMLFFVYLVINLIWTTYLFNMYISDGWIFANMLPNLNIIHSLPQHLAV